MSTSASPSSIDRNVILGQLAVKLEFVSTADLRRAVEALEQDPARSLSEILIELGALAPGRAALLDTLADEQHQFHQDEVTRTVVPSNEPEPGSTIEVLPTLDPSSAPRVATSEAPSAASVRSAFAELLQSGDAPAATLAGPPSTAPQATTLDEGDAAYAATIGTVDGSRPPADPRDGPDAYAYAKTLGTHIPGDGPARTLDDVPATLAGDGTLKAVSGHASRSSHAGRGGSTSGEPAEQAIRYTILKHHAKGGLGDVFVALDEELKREVALKEIQERHADRTDSRMRFLIEAEITGGLEHPGIVPVYGLGNYPDGRPYYAMRFIRGETLRKSIEHFHEADEKPGRDVGDRTIELRGLLRRFLDVCNAIAYAHSRGVLHRDIKPDNVMLGKFGETLVVDWGLAKSVDRPEINASTDEKPLVASSASGSSPTLMGSAVGTPQFMSPEQAEGKLDELGPPCDVYSLGATLFQLLTGEPPFTDKSLLEILRKVRAGDFPRPRAVNPRVPAALEAICLKAMAKEAADRYPTARHLAVDVEHWLADEPVSVYREPFRARVARWSRRHRQAVIAGAVTVATVVAGLIVSNVLIARERDRTAQERDRTAAAKKESDKNYTIAMAAIESMLDEVATIDLADVPLMEPVRRRMLDSALRFYKEFLVDRGEDPTLAYDVGRAYVRMGEILESQGQTPEAEGSFLRGIDALNRLVAATPTNEAKRTLALADFDLGVLYKKSNRYREADARLRSALKQRDAIVLAAGERPEPGLVRESVAALYQLGTLLARQKGRSPEDEQIYRRAIAEQRKLVALMDKSDVSEARRDLARSFNNLGILERNGDPVAAETTFREAYAIQKELEKESPASTTYRWQAARTASNLGAVLAQTARNDPARLNEAEQSFREAIERFQRLAADYPKIPEYRQELAAVKDNLVSLIFLTSRGLPEAVFREHMKECDRLMAQVIATRESLTTDFPARPDYRQGLALALRHQANDLQFLNEFSLAMPLIHRAVDVQRKLAADFPLARDYDLELARTLAMLGPMEVDLKNLPQAALALAESVDLAAKVVEVDRKSADAKLVLGNAAAQLADVSLGLKNYAAAATAADQVATARDDNADEVVRAATFFARLAKADPADAGPKAARCVELLRQAARLGFAKPKVLDGEVFNSVRDREDFVAVRADVVKAAATLGGGPAQNR